MCVHTQTHIIVNYAKEGKYRAELEFRPSFPRMLFSFPESICMFLHDPIGMYKDTDVYVYRVSPQNVCTV